MQDISLLPNWSREKYLANLQKNPLEYKTMKFKLERIFQISPFQEIEYIPDTLDCYVWIKMANEHPNFKSLLAVEKNEKDFSEEFVAICIRHLVLCRKFKNKTLMVLTQQIMLESIKYFLKCFPILQKFPKMINILKQIFDLEKPFYKLNYTNEYAHLVVPPSESEVESINDFLTRLNPGDFVDVFRTEIHSKRACWLPGRVKKVSGISVHVYLNCEKGTHSLDRKWMQIVPFGSRKIHYEWRFLLKVGDKVDIQNFYGCWIVGVISDVRDFEDSENPSGKIMDLKIESSSPDIEWVAITEARLAPFGLFTNQPATNIERGSAETYTDDFNDLLLDPQMSQIAVCRQMSKSQLLMDLVKFSYDEGLFKMILEAVKTRRFNVEVTSELIASVGNIQVLFHRKFAVPYLQSLSDAIFDYVNNCDDITIRNFSKERYEGIVGSLKEFLKRFKSTQERLTLCQNLEFNLILRFINSDFLDRKLYAVSVLTKFFKLVRHHSLRKSQKDFLDWIRTNRILQTIYSQKSHSELIGRSTDFLQFYLLTEPDLEELNPLLEWNEAILKLINDSFDYFPDEFRDRIVQKIKARSSVTCQDAIDIVKRTPGCELWLLRNGGESWISVVKEKSKRRADIAEVFKCPFAVVSKITRQITEIFESKFRSQYFLYLHQVNYLIKVLADTSIPSEQKMEFARISVQPLLQVTEPIYQSFLPFVKERLDQMSPEDQQFFVELLPKIPKKCLYNLFEHNYSNHQDLATLGLGQISLFKECFILANVFKGNIEKEEVQHHGGFSYLRGEKKQIITVTVNPNELFGMPQLLSIIFSNKNIAVTQVALQIIGFLFDNLAEDLASSVFEFKSKFLEICLEQFYETKDQHQKYLKIIEKLLNQSQKNGLDSATPVNALFPSQTITIRVIDHFNLSKSKILLEVQANLTLYELRAQIGRTVNARVEEMKMLFAEKELDRRLNGQVIHTLNLTGSDLIVEKCVTIEKAPLLDSDGVTMSEKCRNVLKSIFKEFSSYGLMSKSQCQKYQQRCQGDMVMTNENKVDETFEIYDKDKDGYLTEEEFIASYLSRISKRPSAVWNDFESFGVRNDLEILHNQEYEFIEGAVMTRHLLFGNKKFMVIMLSLLEAENQSLAFEAWCIISRLPLVYEEDFFSKEPDLSKRYMFRYWLYIIDTLNKYDLVTPSVLERIMSSDIETMCIGLKVAINSAFDVPTFSQALSNLEKIEASKISFYGKVLLDNTLKVMDYFLREDEAIRTHFIDKNQAYSPILTSGLMSQNQAVRKMYCSAIEQIMFSTAADDLPLFQVFFRLVHRNFQECDKATLSIEYFDLYSYLLEILKASPQLLTELKLNWFTLTKSTIVLYMEHKCTETSLNSKPDHVAQGFLRIIRKLLDANTVGELMPLVRFIFQNNLFPEAGQNKLKNAKSRKDAYELIYEICRFRNQSNSSEGLNALFDAGFKAVYKKMSQNKQASMHSFSYLYSYNEARSELGYAGLRNLGCICYMISMLQQLFMTKPFKSMILMAEDGQPVCLAKKGTKEVDDNLFHQLKSMFAHLQLTEKQEYNPEEFCFAFKDFEGNPVNVSVQQDAQQFLNLFFDKMETSLKPTPFRNVFQNIFGGKTCNQTVCSNCKAVSSREETFYPLSLEIKGYRNIEESLKKFITGEVISDYQCDFCKTKCDVTKSCYLAKVPNYFIVHLQRMCFNYDKFENEKVNSRWEFPLKLNVYEYSVDKINSRGDKQDYQYDLKGIVLHYGSADFGHYFSYIKETDEQWIEFNDERVREFDPRDIELDCYGGEHWRRESQSAYLLLYEKVNKSEIKLQFETEEQRTQLIQKFKLTDCIITKENPKQEKKEEEEKKFEEEKAEEEEEKPRENSEQLETESKTEESSKSEVEDKSETEEKPVQKEKTQPKTYPLYLDMLNIPVAIEEDTKAKINKANQEFSFTINLSNDDFAYFLQKILSIDPPADLTTEYLELCYECFHLKQVVEESQGSNLSLSEWATKRFKEIIKGHGWKFLRNFGANWETDILSIEKSSRVAMKNLLECVLTDIIQSSGLNQLHPPTETQENIQEVNLEQQKTVLALLKRCTELIEVEVAKNWTRFKEYFEVWLSLIQNSAFVRRYCAETRLGQKLFDMVMEESSPFPRKTKRYSMGSTHYCADFDYPLQVLMMLIKHGYKLGEVEQSCLRNYVFMEKIMKFPTRSFNLVELVCKDSLVVSEKFAYLALTEISKVTASDEVKPIINSIHKFLEIKDAYESRRAEWILGFPQYLQNPKTSSYGSYNINPETDFILHYVSGIRAVPMLQQLMKFRLKVSHIAALLLSMLLQLESDNIINNLDALPTGIPFQLSYSFWFEEFVTNYYDDQHRSYLIKNYVEYANRIKSLWLNRPNRPFEAIPPFLIGKTSKRAVLETEKVGTQLEITHVEITSYLLLVSEDNPSWKSKHAKELPGAENFKPKELPVYGTHNYMKSDIMDIDSDVEDEPLAVDFKGNPYETATQGNLLIRVAIKNISAENLIVVLQPTESEDCNVYFPHSDISLEVRGDSMCALTLRKKNLALAYDRKRDFPVKIKVMGCLLREGYWPRQLITEVQTQEKTENQREDSSFET